MRKSTPVFDRALIRFTPQAWIRDQAIAVDAEGPTTFEVPAKDAQDASGAWLRDRSDAADVLQEHPNAPDWIRRWHGPFDIEIEYPGKES